MPKRATLPPSLCQEHRHGHRLAQTVVNSLYFQTETLPSVANFYIADNSVIHPTPFLHSPASATTAPALSHRPNLPASK
ncbi:hypothetical protein ERY430_41436 [Erythrobacter sp. EC-HK427]|nr:hypothetical protein ERY430_41436 [Erythrobacter sp. EC-HK427]